MLSRPTSLQQALRTWFTDPMSIPVYLALATAALLLALSTGAAELGWTLFAVYLALSVVAVRVQRPSHR